MQGPMQALRAVMDGRATVAVLPLPDDDEVDPPWWTALMSRDPRTPRIVERLPFLVPEGADGAQHGVLGSRWRRRSRPATTTPSWRSNWPRDTSRGRIKDLMTASGLPPVAYWNYDRSRSGEAPLLLVEVADFVGEDDPRLATLAEKLGAVGQRVQPIGCYPVPLRPGSAHD